MADGTGFPSPVRRALGSLADGSGRTLVVAGPPTSGKSELLEEIRSQLRADGVQVRDLHGSYRDREVPFGVVAALEVPEGPGATPPDGPGAFDGPDREPAEAEPAGEDDAPMAAFPYLADTPPAPRRARGERQRGTIMGMAYSVRSRGVHEMEPGDYWRTLTAGFRDDPARRVAVLVDDGALADAESRQYLLALSERARLRPFLLVLVLDVSEPGYGAWEEKLLGRGDVDWVRIPQSKSDPREVARVKRSFDALPGPTQRILAYAALMGGSVPEVNLSRITRLSFGELAEGLVPAAEEHLVRAESGRILIPHAEWASAIPGFLDPESVRTMHREIAQALEALSPEPIFTRRLEMAEHFFAWDRGPTALRYLVEAAEFSERLGAHDTVIELLLKALQCLPSLPAAERPLTEAELRLFLARALLYAGLPDEAERHLEEGLVLALAHRVKPEQLEDWLEPIVPAVLAVGPRPSLVTEVGELVDRLQDAGVRVPEILFQSVAAILEFERGRVDRARHEAYRAGQTARRVEKGPVQALALSVVGLTHSTGSDAEARLSARFLRSSSTMFAGARRFGLQQIAEGFRARLLAGRGEFAQALETHQRAVQVLRRLHIPALELSHQLGIADILLETKPDARAAEALQRAREIVEALHLVPPASALVLLWYLEGRQFELSQVEEAARERYSALADRPEASVPPAVRRRAIDRLIRLDVATDRLEEAKAYFAQLSAHDLGLARKPKWSDWLATLGREAEGRVGLPDAAGR